MIETRNGFFSIPSMPYHGGIVWWDGSKRQYIIEDPTTHNRTEVNIPVVQLEDDVVTILKWAAQKMREEHELKAKIASSEALKESYNNFQTILALTK